MKQQHKIIDGWKLGIMLGLSLLFNFQLSTFNSVWAQMPGGKAVQLSRKTEVVNGKRFFIHIVEQGQTVYAISRAYGLKEVEAVTKKDIHFLQVGDTVWLPCKGQRLSDGTLAPQATGASTTDVRPQGPAAKTGTTAKEADSPEEPQGPPAIVRPRVNSQSIVVSLMMPFNLSQMGKISTSKFDVEQRGKISYKSLEFIQFYEGLLLGLDKLEKQGYHITLNVVDVEGTSDEAVEQAFRSHNVAQSDLLIALLTRQPFEKAASLAREAQLFIVNPVADRSEIVKGNPYVFKCTPSREACATAIVGAIRRAMPEAPVLVIHSTAKEEKPLLKALTAEMDRYGSMKYSQLEWSNPAKLTPILKSNPRMAVVSVFDKDKSSKRIYVSQLLNKLSSAKGKMPTLFTIDDWATNYTDVDFAQLQNLSYHTFYSEWDMSDKKQKDFVDLFRDKYKTEPVGPYAGRAYDVILYFVTGLQAKGTDFFKNPAIAAPQGMLSPMTFSHTRVDCGFENQSALLYRMTDFHFTPVQ